MYRDVDMLARFSFYFFSYDTAMYDNELTKSKEKYNLKQG